MVDTKLTVRNMIEQLDTQLKQTVEESPFYGPVKQFPEAISAAARTRLTAQYRAAISGELYPALTRLRDFLKTDYLPQARDGVGLPHELHRRGRGLPGRVLEPRRVRRARHRVRL